LRIKLSTRSGTDEDGISGVLFKIRNNLIEGSFEVGCDRHPDFLGPRRRHQNLKKDEQGECKKSYHHKYSQL
jgi:hypothetical protein